MAAERVALDERKAFIRLTENTGISSVATICPKNGSELMTIIATQ